MTVNEFKNIALSNGVLLSDSNICKLLEFNLNTWTSKLVDKSLQSCLSGLKVKDIASINDYYEYDKIWKQINAIYDKEMKLKEIKTAGDNWNT
jgi:hypothetical protein